MKIKSPYINLYRSVLIIIIFFSIATYSNSQELILKEFKHLEGNTTARIYRKRDVNGQNCAVLIIKHNFKNFIVESGKGYEALEEKTGETWVWLSPDEYRIVIRREGYIPFEINLRDKLKELETYELVLTDDFGSILINAPGANIWINNKLVSKDEYKSRLKEGDYNIKATKDNCSPDERNVKMIAGDSLKIQLAPSPFKAKVVIESEPINTYGASIIIDGQEIDQKTPATILLELGEHKITLKKPDFIDATKVISVITQENYALTMQMQRLNLDPQIRKHKIKRNYWFLSTIICSGITAYSYYKTNQLANEYKTATTDAEKIRKEYEFYKTLSPIALSTSGISLTFCIVHSVKLHDAKVNLKLAFQMQPDCKALALHLNF